MGRAQGQPNIVTPTARRSRHQNSHPGTLAGRLQRVTSKGVAVTLDLRTGIGDGIKDGWTVDLVEARTADGPAGYLKLAFIPKAGMDRYYPDAFTWAVRESGSYYTLRELVDKPETEWTREQLMTAFTATDRRRQPDAERDSLSDPELRALWASRRQEIAGQHQRAYRQFRRFHLDRPLVDYIRVYDGRDRLVYQDGVRLDLPQALGRDCQRQGLATVLYETGAVWMAQRGLKMHASGLQSKDAKGAWASLHARGLVKTVRGTPKSRRVLDAERLLAEHPELRLAL